MADKEGQDGDGTAAEVTGARRRELRQFAALAIFFRLHFEVRIGDHVVDPLIFLSLP